MKTTFRKILRVVALVVLIISIGRLATLVTRADEPWKSPPLEWDEYPDADKITGFALWTRKLPSETWAWSSSVLPSAREIEIPFTAAGEYEYRLTAFKVQSQQEGPDFTMHSEPSNVVAVFIPESPNLRVGPKVALQFSRDLKAWESVAIFTAPADWTNFFARVTFIE